MRRVVTGIGKDGESTVVLDGTPSNFHEMASAPGFSRAVIWASAGGLRVPVQGDPAPDVVSLHPEPDETRCLLLTLPPDSTMLEPGFDPEAFAREGLDYNRGIFERMEPGDPGMHATDTLDYNVVIEGELWLRMGDGSEVHLKAGDVIVQTGTRHAWHNRTAQPAKMFSVLVGARRARG